MHSDGDVMKVLVAIDSFKGSLSSVEAGNAVKEAEICNEHGVDAFFPILRGVNTFEEAIEKTNARENLTATAYQVFRLLCEVW